VRRKTPPDGDQRAGPIRNSALSHETPWENTISRFWRVASVGGLGSPLDGWFAGRETGARLAYATRAVDGPFCLLPALGPVPWPCPLALSLLDGWSQLDPVRAAQPGQGRCHPYLQPHRQRRANAGPERVTGSFYQPPGSQPPSAASGSPAGLLKPIPVRRPCSDPPIPIHKPLSCSDNCKQLIWSSGLSRG
jgi:hypothetical protein